MYQHNQNGIQIRGCFLFPNILEERCVSPPDLHALSLIIPAVADTTSSSYFARLAADWDLGKIVTSSNPTQPARNP